MNETLLCSEPTTPGGGGGWDLSPSHPEPRGIWSLQGHLGPEQAQTVQDSDFKDQPVLGGRAGAHCADGEGCAKPSSQLGPQHCRQLSPALGQHRLPPAKILSHLQKPHILHSERLPATLEFPLPSLDNGKETKDWLSNVRPELSTPEISKYEAQNKTRLDLITIEMPLIIYFHIKIVMGLMKTSMYF